MRRLTSVSILTALLVTACRDLPTNPNETQAVSGPPSAVISDGAHGGRAGFYFLPPLVRRPAVTGTFDPELLPYLKVEVCEWDGTGCVGGLVAEFSAEAGTGDEKIRIVGADEHDDEFDNDEDDERYADGHGAREYDWGGDDYDCDECDDDDDEYYIVEWDTEDSDLDPEKTYRLRIMAGSVELGVADLDVVSSGKELKNVDTGEYVALRDGRTVPIKFRLEEGAIPILVQNRETAPNGHVAFASPRAASGLEVEVLDESGSPLDGILVQFWDALEYGLLLLEDPRSRVRPALRVLGPLGPVVVPTSSDAASGSTFQATMGRAITSVTLHLSGPVISLIPPDDPLSLPTEAFLRDPDINRFFQGCATPSQLQMEPSLGSVLIAPLVGGKYILTETVGKVADVLTKASQLLGVDVSAVECYNVNLVIPPQPTIATVRVLEPATGDLRLTVRTSGSDPDTDGYRAILDETTVIDMTSNDNVSIRGLIAWVHTVRLEGVAANCNVEGNRSRDIDVTRNTPVTVAFVVSCVSTTPPAPRILFLESFSTDLSQWIPRGFPSSFITSAEGTPAPALSINGDASWDSGLESVVTFGPSDITANGGITITFEVLRPNIPLGNDFIDGGVWLGKVVIASPDIRVAGIRYEPNASFGGRFRFWHMTAAGLTGPQSTVAVTNRRWIPLRVVIRPDFIAEFYVDNVLEFTTSSPIVFPSGGPVPLAISGRRHFVDNVQVLAGVHRSP